MPFRDVIGHRQLVRLIARSVRRDSLPPSLIFSGPSGIGKRFIAVATGQALNCTTPISSASPEREIAEQTAADEALDFDACGRCPSCKRIARGVHPDVLLVEPGDNGSIKVDQVREVVDRAGYRPFEGRRRLVIINDADALVAPAQNALLKTLEEPPSASMFVLVTARPDVLLATVRSRCPQLRFRPLAPDEVARGLVVRGHDQRAAHAIAATADGSLGRALDMSGTDLLAAREIAQQVLAGAAAGSDPRQRLEGAKDLLSGTGAGGASDREQIASYLRAMGSLLRDMEVLSTGADVGVLANADVRPALDRLAPAYRGERGVRAFAAVDQALVALDRNAGVKIIADWLMLQL